MKNRLITLSFRKIKDSFKRFFSLAILSLLGISFFTGMRITMPGMLLSLDKYYKENNVYDVEILSTNGLNEKDVEEMLNHAIKEGNPLYPVPKEFSKEEFRKIYRLILC